MAKHRKRTPKTIRSPRKRVKTAPFQWESEPTYDPEDHEEIVECCGELYWAVDFTGAGFPIGVRVSEMREMDEREARRRNAGWAEAKQLLRDVFSDRPDVDIGRVIKIGEGLSHEVFAGNVEWTVHQERQSETYAVCLPSRDADPQRCERCARERLLLDHISRQTIGIRVPKIFAVVPTQRGDAIVRPYLRGIPLNFRSGTQPGVRPPNVVAEVAAAVHAIDVSDFELSKSYPTRRAHAEAVMTVFRDLPELAEFAQWTG
jgi:hypothetical protein